MRSFKIKFVLLSLCGISFSAFTAWAMPVEPEKQAMSSNQIFASLPVKQDQETSQGKSKRALELSQWVTKTLEAEHAQVAIISRKGSPLTVLFDKTGMTHSGYVFRSPKNGQWITYSLYSNPEAGYKKSRLWQQSLQNFYYGQRSHKSDALLMIPSAALQEKLYARLTAVPFDSILPQDEHYSLVAPLESQLSFNCTKWTVLFLFATKENSNKPSQLIHKMTEEYQVPGNKASLLLRYVLKKKPDVNWQELSPPNYIHTVTVDSLYKSSLFEKKFYYHAR